MEQGWGRMCVGKPAQNRETAQDGVTDEAENTQKISTCFLRLQKVVIIKRWRTMELLQGDGVQEASGSVSEADADR